MEVKRGDYFLLMPGLPTEQRNTEQKTHWLSVRFSSCSREAVGAHKCAGRVCAASQRSSVVPRLWRSDARLIIAETGLFFMR